MMSEPPHRMDPYTEELFKKIKEHNVTVDPEVWALLNHVLGNRVYTISLILGDFLATPRWILNAGSRVMKFLYAVSGKRGELSAIDEAMRRALDNAFQIKGFLNRLREISQQKPGF